MKRLAFLGLGVIAAGLYLLVLPRYPIGYAIDDALYILAAKSLTLGRYVALHMPGQPPLTDPLPGFPLLLAPFIVLVRGHWALLKAISFVVTLSSVILFARLLRRWVEGWALVTVVALFAFNPTTVNFSGIVVSEPFFLFLVLVILLTLSGDTEFSPGGTAAIGLGLGWAMLVRPQGIALGFAVVIALWAARKRRVAAMAGLFAFLPVATVLWRNHHVAQTATGYLSHWAATLPSLLRSPLHWLANAGHVLQTLVLENLLALPADAANPIRVALGLALTIAVCLVIIVGLVESWSRHRESMLFVAWSLFSAGFLSIHLFWAAVDVHYLYPVLPFFLYLLWLGAEALAQKVTENPMRVGLLFVPLLARYAYCGISAIPTARHPAFHVARTTYQWMASELPPEALVYAPATATVGLFSHRFVFYTDPPGDADQFRYDLLRSGATHVLTQPVNLLSLANFQGSPLSANQRWARAESFISGWSAAFHPVYSNESDGTLLYLVVPDPGYLKAYPLYREAYAYLNHADWKGALSRLDEALKRCPDFPGALNAYSTALYLSGQSAAQVEKHLKRAIALRPEYPMAWMNLGRIYLKANRIPEARDAFEKVRNFVSKTGESPRLLDELQLEYQQ